MPDTTPDEAAVEALAEREALTKALFTHIDTNALGAVRDATALVSVLEVLAEDLLRSGVRKPPSGHRVVSEGPWAGKAVQDGHPERPYYPDGREDRSSSEGDGSGEAVDQRTVRAARGGEHVPGAGATGSVVHDDHVGRLTPDLAPIEGPTHEPQGHLDHDPSVAPAASPERLQAEPSTGRTEPPSRPDWWVLALSLDDYKHYPPSPPPYNTIRRLARQVDALQEALREVIEWAGEQDTST